MSDLTDMCLAADFHETYERLSPQFGYETRRDSAVPWDQVPERNRELMRAVCREIIARHVEPYREELHQLRQGDPMSDLVQANRDELLRMHQEAVRRVRKRLEHIVCNRQADNGPCPGPLTCVCSEHEAMRGIAVLNALNQFHPMHAENWPGWPEGSEP